MKIMYVNTLGTWGGVATYLKPLIEDQVKRGNYVSLVVGSKGYLTTYVSEHYPNVDIKIVDNMYRDVHIFSSIKAIFEMRKIIKKIKPDIIHFNCIMAGLIGRLSNIGLNNKTVYNAHGWAFEPGTSKKFMIPAIIIEKFLAYFTDKIICVSNYEYDIANRYRIFKNKNQPTIIKNSSKDIGIVPSDDLKDDTFRITMAARFWKQKNQLLLIKSFEKVLKSKKIKNKIILYLLGDGPTVEECFDYVQQHNMNKNVIFTGTVNNVKDYYAKSDVVALITNYDAIAISLIEALSMGKPLIASNVGGVSENFDGNKNGYCIENNISDIYESIFKVIKNEKLRKKMGSCSRKFYLKYFTQNENLKNHNICYEKLIN
ncbi:glycosyltransferase [Apilactobacillus timberlakei]|nr:glycosyltransferase [Apilactobacillus timberlakei]